LFNFCGRKRVLAEIYYGSLAENMPDMQDLMILNGIIGEKQLLKYL